MSANFAGLRATPQSRPVRRSPRGAPAINVPIRIAEERDIATIVEHVNLAYRVEDFFIEGNRTHESEVGALLARDTFFLAEDESGLLASVHVRISGDRGYLGMLSVHPRLQGRGLGRRMVAEAERFAAESGCRFMDLTYVNLREELPAFYRKLGYRETGTAPFTETWKLRMPAEFITMSRELALAPAPGARR